MRITSIFKYLELNKIATVQYSGTGDGDGGGESNLPIQIQVVRSGTRNLEQQVTNQTTLVQVTRSPAYDS